MENRFKLLLTVAMVIFLFLAGNSIFCETINSGYVIAYGKPVKKPFNVTMKDHKIFLNNIQVMPYIVDSEKLEPNEQRKIQEECSSQYFDWKNKYGDTKAVKMLNDYLSKKTKIKSYKYRKSTTSNYYDILYKNGNKYQVFLKLPPRSQYEIANQLEQKFKNKYMEWYELYGRQKALKMLREMVSSEPLVDKYIIENRTWEIFYKNGVEKRALGGIEALELLPEKVKWLETETNKAEEKYLEKEISNIKKCLNSQCLIIYFRGGYHIYPNDKAEVMYKGIDKIMSVKTDDRLNIKLLHKLINDPTGEIENEIINNYQKDN